jgi:acyl-CoA oxidase
MNSSKGVKAEAIQHKLPLRIVQNCDITYTDVFVPDDCKLEKTKSFL